MKCIREIGEVSFHFHFVELSHVHLNNFINKHLITKSCMNANMYSLQMYFF